MDSLAEASLTGLYSQNSDGQGFLFALLRLGKNGSQAIYPYRGEHYKMMRLKVTGDLGQVCPSS